MQGYVYILQQPEFEWTKKFKGLVLSSYFYGYIITQVPGGWLCGRFGAKHVLGVGLLVSAIVTLISPPLTRVNANSLIVLRVILGLASVSCFHRDRITRQRIWVILLMSLRYQMVYSSVDYLMLPLRTVANFISLFSLTFFFY